MSEEILVNVTSSEIRVAVLASGIVQEIHVERASQQGMVGRLYKGKVSRVVRGMQSAFIDIGLERSAFLHVSDTLQSMLHQKQEPLGSALDIADFIHPGQEIIVQIYKDPIGSKGARLTTQFGIPSRYLVFTPYFPVLSLSQKITDEDERERLLKLVTLNPEGGYVIRTAAAQASKEELQEDQAFLKKMWEQIQSRMPNTRSGELVYDDLAVELRVLRDLASRQVEKISVDDEKIHQKMQAFAAEFMPGLQQRLCYYDQPWPMFDFYGIEEEIQKALLNKVSLKSGGYIVIDQTEAMTTIDVNTGSYLGHAHFDQTVLKINLEAAAMIAHQIKLRNLGGIIIIDFIDMQEVSHQQEVLDALMKAVSLDAVRVIVGDMSSLGLVQMTRKRVRESLERVLCDPCPLCQKKGFILSLATVSYGILREIKRINVIQAWSGFLLMASPEVIHFLKEKEEAALNELALKLGKPIQMQVEMTYSREQYSVLPLG